MLPSSPICRFSSASLQSLLESILMMIPFLSVPPGACLLQATVAIIGLVELVVAPVWRSTPAALGLAFSVLVRYDPSTASLCSLLMVLGYVVSLVLKPEWERSLVVMLIALLFITPVVAVFLLVLVCGISEDLLANRFTRLESGLLAQLAACGSIAITRHSTLSSVPSAWTAMLASTLVLFGCLLMLARLDLSPRRIQSPLYSLLLSAVYLLSRSICSERAERSIAALVEYIGTPSHCTTLFWWGLAILIGVGGTQLTESVHVFGQGSRGTIIVRKLFHLLAVVLFQPVVISDPEFLGFSQFIALGLFIVLEALRVYHTHLKIVKKLSGYLVQYLDGKDPSDGGIIFTHISLLLGLSIPVWFELGYSSEFSVLRASAGILSVGVGDAMAACVGVTVRGPKIPGAERRTIAGLIGFVVSAMGYGLAVMTGGDWAMMWRRSGMAICATAFLECYITSIDNLVLPVYMLALLAF